jgi:hypothetical protein
MKSCESERQFLGRRIKRKVYPASQNVHFGQHNRRVQYARSCYLLIAHICFRGILSRARWASQR